MQENYCNLRSQFSYIVLRWSSWSLPYIQNQEFPGCSLCENLHHVLKKTHFVRHYQIYFFLKEMVIFNYYIILLSRKLMCFQVSGERWAVSPNPIFKLPYK